MSLPSLQPTLKAFSDHHNLKERAFKRCMEALQNCFADDPQDFGGIAIPEIALEFMQQEFIFEHYVHATPFVKIRIDLFRKAASGDPIRMGCYELDINLEGEIIDDWVIVNAEK